MMTFEEKVQEWKQDAATYRAKYTEAYQKASHLETALTAAQARVLELEAARRWIPVTERLPQYKPNGENTYPVVYPSFIDGRPALFVASIDRNGRWIDEHGLNMFWHSKITYWVDLPLPVTEDTAHD
jgi:hypothetical protein